MFDEKTIEDKKGRSIRLVWDEFQEVCTASHEGTRVGEFRFSAIHEDRSSENIMLLTHCHLEEQPGFTGCGIGTAIIEFVRERGCAIVMRHHDGLKRDDGSHLTGSAPGFAAALEASGLISRYGRSD